jgi:hypothetical protein
VERERVMGLLDNLPGTWAAISISALSTQLGEGGVEELMARLTSEDGLLSGLDLDGDGNPINDLTRMARGLFNQ